MSWSDRKPRRVALRALRCITATALAVSMAGCTLVGFAVGAKIDSSHKEFRVLKGWDVESVKTGTRIRVTLRITTPPAGR
jgi:hypothetical protein